MIRIPKTALLVLVACSLFSPLLRAGRQDLSGACRRLIEDAAARGIRTGFMVLDAASARVLAKHDPDEPLIPASNMKILTAGAALLELGPDYEIYTDVLAHGPLEDGSLAGDLRLRGEGDPTLGSRGEGNAPAAIVAALREAGVGIIQGDLLVDDRIFKDERIGPEWPLSNPTARYVAEVAGLSLDHGTVRVIVRGAKVVGAPARVSYQPAGAGLTIRNKVRTVAAGASRGGVSARRNGKPGEVVLMGRLPVGAAESFEIAVEDPALVFGRVVAAELRKAGIRLVGVVRRPEPGEKVEGGRLILRLATPVREVIGVLLKRSQNHRAEMLFKHLGAARGSGGTFAGGAAAVRRIFEGRGAVLRGVVVRDGSGLSRGNRLTARALSQILLILWRSPHRKLFRESLPHGGGEGTLRRRLRSLGERVAAKTGTLNHVSALSGYVDDSSGATLIFSILTNGGRTGEMRRLQDELVRRVAAEERSR